jgi:hypothetical protein
MPRALRGNRIPLPDTRQKLDHTCGPAVLSAIFSYWGEHVREEDLAEELKSDPIGGTSPDRLNYAAMSRGFHTMWRERMTNAELRRHLNIGRPVIVTVQAWATPTELKGDSGHYVIAIDYDKENVYFEDPALDDCRGYIPWKELDSRWYDKNKAGKPFKRFGLVVWKDTKPVTESIITNSVFIHFEDAPFVKGDPSVR